MFFVKVPKEDGEKTRIRLLKRGMLSGEYKIECMGNDLFLPVTVKKGRYEFVELPGTRQEHRCLTLADALSGMLSPAELRELITSFDVIGDIAIIEIPQKLAGKQRLIAETLMRVQKNVKVVAKKTGAMKGRYRVRPLRVIAGEKRTETVYTEHGVRMFLDPSKAYFSVRLSTERKRIATIVRDGENILALFAGIGPFPLVISKYKPKAKLIAIELNPHAVKYMERNIALNKAKNITVVRGDARKVVLQHYANFADRVLMPLPKSAETFLDVAFAGVKNNGVVHIYSFAPVSDPYSAIKRRIMTEAKKVGASVSFLNGKIVRPYAPNVAQVVVDFRVRK